MIILASLVIIVLIVIILVLIIINYNRSIENFIIKANENSSNYI